MSKNTSATMEAAFSIPSPAPVVNPYKTTTAATTPAPDAPKVKDPHEYEKSIFKGCITDHTIEVLKDQIREARGLKPVLPPPSMRKKKDACAFPPPRETETSRIRAEMRRYRLIQRCGEFNKYFMGQHSEVLSCGPLDREQQQELVNKAKHMNCEEIAQEERQCEIDFFKYSSEQPFRPCQDYRPNRASEIRFKYIRGEPILSSNYITNYNFHEKPPFVIARKYQKFPVWRLPPIDKQKEIWLIPQEDYAPLPVLQPVEPPKPVHRCESRPTLKPHCKSSGTGTSREPKPTKRPPWNSYLGGRLQTTTEPPASTTTQFRRSTIGSTMGSMRSTTTGSTAEFATDASASTDVTTESSIESSIGSAMPAVDDPAMSGKPTPGSSAGSSAPTTFTMGDIGPTKYTMGGPAAGPTKFTMGGPGAGPTRYTMGGPYVGSARTTGPAKGASSTCSTRKPTRGPCRKHGSTTGPTMGAKGGSFTGGRKGISGSSAGSAKQTAGGSSASTHPGAESSTGPSTEGPTCPSSTPRTFGTCRPYTRRATTARSTTNTTCKVATKTTIGGTCKGSTAATTRGSSASTAAGTMSSEPTTGSTASIEHTADSTTMPTTHAADSSMSAEQTTDTKTESAEQAADSSTSDQPTANASAQPNEDPSGETSTKPIAETTADSTKPDSSPSSITYTIGGFSTGLANGKSSASKKHTASSSVESAKAVTVTDSSTLNTELKTASTTEYTEPTMECAESATVCTDSNSECPEPATECTTKLTKTAKIKTCPPNKRIKRINNRCATTNAESDGAHTEPNQDPSAMSNFPKEDTSTKSTELTADLSMESSEPIKDAEPAADSSMESAKLIINSMTQPIQPTIDLSTGFTLPTDVSAEYTRPGCSSKGSTKDTKGSSAASTKYAMNSIKQTPKSSKAGRLFNAMATAAVFNVPPSASKFTPSASKFTKKH